jgi:uncharacterized protein (DUF849 family)
MLHVHAFDDDGIETLAPDPNATVLGAIRAACPGVPFSLTTRAELEPDAARRLELIMSWTELPDLVTANQGDSGIAEICGYLSDRGVGIEAGLLELDDAEIFNRYRLSQGHGIRTGLEDTTVLPDGTQAADNTGLIDAAKTMILDQDPENR